jgi:predicted  nucleic acid-binding Zn-ribbon protein
MKKRALLILAGLLTASMVAFVACDDEPTQQQANEDFCDAAAELVASLRNIQDLDSDSTLDEIDDARARARDAREDMIAAAGGVVEAKLDEFNDAWDALQQAVDDLDEGATLDEALDDLQDEIDDVSTEAAQLLNDVDCSGVGSEGNSDE